MVFRVSEYVPRADYHASCATATYPRMDNFFHQEVDCTVIGLPFSFVTVIEPCSGFWILRQNGILFPDLLHFLQEVFGGQSTFWESELLVLFGIVLITLRGLIIIEDTSHMNEKAIDHAISYRNRCIKQRLKFIRQNKHTTPLCAHRKRATSSHPHHHTYTARP